MDFRDISEFIKDSAKYILVIVLVLVIVIYVASLQQVVGPSMSKTLNNKDIILIDKLSYRFSEPKRFDVISFEYAETKYLIKRIIGMPGEHIKYVDNVLYVNDVEYGDKNGLNEITDDFDIKKLGFEIENIKNYSYTVKIFDEQKAHELLKELVIKGITINKFEIMKPTLNDIFIEKVGE